MTLSHFQRCGHRVIAVVGGATGMIGDPSGKTGERNLLDAETIANNVVGIRENLSRFLDFDDAEAPATIINNADWLSNFSYLEFLRDVGKYFRMGTMLGKDSVRSRLEGEAGMSYTEFSYQLLQAYDFLHLYDHHGCTVQVGGSDQWGNITAGTELIRRQRGAEAFGVTTPLICDSAGQKFGKSEGNAIYLDADRTSVYDFYQFFVRSADADVIGFLKAFTAIPLEEIRELETQTTDCPESRSAQKRLAEEMTRLVHGDTALHAAQRATAVLFGESMQGLDAKLLAGIFSDAPSTALPRREVEAAGLIDLACASGLCASRSAARRLIESGGLYLNNERVTDESARVETHDIIDDQLLVLRSGKKKFHLIKLV